MTDPLPIQGIQPVSAGDSKASPKVTPDGGAKFQVLLDRLQAETRGLQQSSDSLSDPAELAGVVDQARNALNDAQTLGKELLEAYRAARQTSQPNGAKQ
ncbi:MAG: hypothetical protein ACI8QC_002143 [Planctomycetota bacterium]|jgi:hypothetical protein